MTNQANATQPSNQPVTPAVPYYGAFNVHRVARTMHRQSASLGAEIAELEQAAGNRTLSKWEQKRLHTMRIAVTRNTSALALYGVRFHQREC